MVSKIREHEENEVKIGDEVESAGGSRFVVVRIRDNGSFEGINSAGVDEGLDLNKFKQTGRHFPQIAEVLEQMKGE